MKISPAYGLLSAVVIFEIIADVLFKYWSLNNRLILLVTGTSLYTIGTLLWAYTLRYETLTVTVMIFSIGNLVGASIFGIFWFNEQLTTQQYIGILLGFISVMLLLT